MLKSECRCCNIMDYETSVKLERKSVEVAALHCGYFIHALWVHLKCAQDEENDSISIDREFNSEINREDERPYHTMTLDDSMLHWFRSHCS